MRGEDLTAFQEARVVHSVNSLIRAVVAITTYGAQAILDVHSG